MKKLTWTSSKAKVATVTKKGKVTAKSVGKAKITAKTGTKKFICKVTVKKKVSQKQYAEVDTTSTPVQLPTPYTVVASEIDKFTYSERAEGDGITITGYKDNTVTDLTIPSQIGGRPVKSIGNRAFDMWQSLVHVTFEEGIETIENDCFCNCVSLNSVDFADSIQRIGRYCFSSCYQKVSMPYQSACIS